MNIKTIAIATLALAATAQPAFAVQPVGTHLANVIGTHLSLGVHLPPSIGGAMPVGFGGVAAIAAVSLVLGVQLIKRRKK